MKNESNFSVLTQAEQLNELIHEIEQNLQNTDHLNDECADELRASIKQLKRELHEAQ